jgi:hypothetical protein
MRFEQEQDVQQARERDLWARISSLEDVVKALQVQNAILQSGLTPSVINLLRNCQYDFTHRDYFPTSPNFAGDDTAAAHWYARDYTDTTLWDENTNTVLSAAALLTTGAGKTKWNSTSGAALFGSNATLVTPLKKLYAARGRWLYARAIIRYNPSVIVNALADDLYLVAQLWESISGSALTREVAGDNITATATKNGPHTTGGWTREYVVEALSIYDLFNSGAVVPIAATVTNSNPLSTADASSYVTINWQSFEGVSEYRVYRRMRLDTDPAGTGTVTLIGKVLSGGTTFLDRNGAGTSASGFVTLSKPRCRSLIVNFGKLAKANQGQWITVDFPLYVPASYALPTGAGDQQWLRLGTMTVTSGYPTTMSDNQSFEVDRISLSYTYGDWNLSADDQLVTAKPISTTPAADAGGNSGGEVTGVFGEGRVACVTLEQMVLMADGTEKPAGELVVGDRVSVPFCGKIESGSIRKIVRGWTSRVYTIHSSCGRSIRCSPSHPILTFIEDKTGTQAKDFLTGHGILVKHGDAMLEGAVDAIEYIDTDEPVVIFEVDHPAHTAIVSSIGIHNVKIYEQQP